MIRVSAAIVTYNNKILLFLRDNKPNILDPNCWSLIGGHVEDNESFDDGLIRELQEEISITPTSFKFLFNFKGSINEEVNVYHIKLSDKEAQEIKLGDEGQKVEFKTLDEMEKLGLTQNLDELFKSYRNYFEEVIIT